MSRSGLAATFVQAKNYSKGRDGKRIRCITPHIMAAKWSAEQCARFFAGGSRKASTHYVIGINGEIIQCVDEKDTAWANANWKSNCESITIECANVEIGGEWRISDATLNSLINLMEDIARRHNIKLVVGDTLNWHSMYTNTACVPVDTELLTEQGWKQLKDIKEGEKVASADLDNLNISFEEVYYKVPEKKQDVYLNNNFYVTKDHRMVYRMGTLNKEYRIDRYDKLQPKGDINNFFVPLAGNNIQKGIEITDDMIRFLVMVQADGHYIYEILKSGEKSFYGLDFHLKKERKVERSKEILQTLGLKYTISNKRDGSVSIKVFNEENINIVKDICENKYLNNKKFTWELLKMNEKQANIFFEELLEWDGCKSGNYYSSVIEQNLDVVSALASINNRGSYKDIKNKKIMFRDSNQITIFKKEKRIQQKAVSCVSVKTGIILVRQKGRTFIVGNCPRTLFKE